MKQPHVFVIGSFMMDLVVRTPRVPEEGETIIGLDFRRSPGGKGANQAVAAARLGAKVTMAGKLGKDGFGDIFLEVLEKESINIENILRTDSAATGIGSIMLDQKGNNRIVVVPGANLKYDFDDLRQIESLLSESDILMLQLEMDPEVMAEAVNLAYKINVPVLLNPAPAQALSDELLSKVRYLTPNETEAEILTGIKVSDLASAEEAAKQLLTKGVSNVVVTLGGKGALMANGDGVEHIPAFSVEPIDTVAAGDAFNGALATAVAGGKPLAEAVRLANAAGALAVTKPGAIPSLPNKADIEEFLESQRVL